MGLKVQAGFFGRTEVLLIVGVLACALPSAFFIAHSLAVAAGVRRPMGDLLAGGTMICGASAVNAVAPVSGARREEQGLAIGVVFLFSVFALLTFRPVSIAVGLSPSMAGLWSGLAVNDLASAIAVGNQMGGAGGVMATAAKSARILMLAPMLIALSLMRREGAAAGMRKSIVESLPRFILGYIALAVLRTAGDRLFGSHPAWLATIAVDKLLVDLTMAVVAASIGLHLALGRLLAAGGRAIVVGGGTSLWMASLTLGMIVAVSRNAQAAAALVGGVALLISYSTYRVSTRKETVLKQLRQRFETGSPLSLAEATLLLDGAERRGPLDDALLRRILTQLHPSIGELIPVRESALQHGEGCRWVTYWEGQSGWALVAVCREAGASTPIHAHPHRLLGKAVEGLLEEVRFAEIPGVGGELSVISRDVLAHNAIVETDGLKTLHLVRAVGPSPAIDLQLRGPEDGKPGRRLRTRDALDVSALSVGMRLFAVEEIDDRPGHGGEGAKVGRMT